MKKGVADTAIMSIGKVLSIILAIAVQSMLARLLGPEDRGAFAVCQVFATILMTIACFGTNSAATYYVASKKLKPGAVISVLLIQFLGCFILLPFIGYWLIQLPLPFFQKATFTAFFLAIFWACSTQLSVYAQALAIAFRMFHVVVGGVNVLRQVCTVAFLAVFCWALDWSLNGAILAFILGLAVSSVASIAYMWKREVPQLALPDKDVLRKIYHYGSRMLLGSITQIVDNRVGLILVAMFLPEKQIGFFAVSMAVYMQSFSPADILRTVIAPRIAASPDGRPDLVVLSGRLMFGFSLCYVALFTLGGRLIITLLFSENFLPSLTILYFLFPALVLECMTRCTYAYFEGTNHPGVISISTAIRLAVNLSVMVLAIPIWGVNGAAASVSLSILIHSIIMLSAFAYYSSVNPLTFFVPPVRELRSLKTILSGKK
jgi:O-antigen/teichoic acid export membrane protein